MGSESQNILHTPQLLNSIIDYRSTIFNLTNPDSLRIISLVLSAPNKIGAFRTNLVHNFLCEAGVIYMKQYHFLSLSGSNHENILERLYEHNYFNS